MTPVERQADGLDEDSVIDVGKKVIRHVVRINSVVREAAYAAEIKPIVVPVFHPPVALIGAGQPLIDVHARHVVAVDFQGDLPDGIGAELHGFAELIGLPFVIGRAVAPDGHGAGNDLRPLHIFRGHGLVRPAIQRRACRCNLLRRQWIFAELRLPAADIPG